MEDALVSRPSLVRRHTDQPFDPQPLHRRPTLPEMHTSPELSQKPIDMNLAYGEMHESHIPPTPEQKEIELKQQMSRLDSLLLEAQCIGHSATTIIQSLQKNPEAMAAVALTLAEISNLVKIMSPGILSAIKGSSPAIFALLICPEFLIGTGLAVGVTIVMFGGYKIIKKIQANNAAAAALQKETAIPPKVDAEGNQMEEAMVYDGDLSSVETWMRGVEESQIGEGSVATSVDGEFITPEAASIRRMRTREKIAKRAKEERARTPSSVASRSEYSYTAPPRGGSLRSMSVVTDRTRGGAERGGMKDRRARTMAESDIADSDRDGRKQKKEKEKGNEKEKEKDGRKEKGKETEKVKEKKPSVLKVLFKGKSEKVRTLGA